MKTTVKYVAVEARGFRDKETIRSSVLSSDTLTEAIGMAQASQWDGVAQVTMRGGKIVGLELVYHNHV